MEFRIADTFTSSLTKLAADEQKLVKQTAFDAQVNPAKGAEIMPVHVPLHQLPLGGDAYYVGQVSGVQFFVDVVDEKLYRIDGQIQARRNFFA